MVRAAGYRCGIWHTMSAGFDATAIVRWNFDAIGRHRALQTSLAGAAEARLSRREGQA